MRFRRACASVEGRSIDGQNHISSNGESFKPGLARERFELRDRHGRIGYEGVVMHAEIVERPRAYPVYGYGRERPDHRFKGLLIHD
jgi:hypothetical protein